MRDASGASSTASRVVDVVRETLEVSITASDAALVRSAVRFGLKINPAPVEPVSYAWTFGDGGRSSLPRPQYAYKRTGTYTVTVTVAAQGRTTRSTLHSRRL